MSDATFLLSDLTVRRARYSGTTPRSVGAWPGPNAVLHTDDTDWGSGVNDNTEAPDLAFVQDPDVLGGMDLPNSGSLTFSWDERACRE